MNFEEYNILGGIVEDVYGTARTSESNGSFKIVSKIVGENRLRITCMVVVNLLNRSDMKNETDKAYAKKSKLNIEIRSGEYTRCKGNYCSVAEFCNQYKGDGNAKKEDTRANENS